MKATRYNKGFTLIETIIAILILTMTIGALLSLAAGGFYSVKYARNQIVADGLLQESLEYIHNSRDTAFQAGGTWDSWLASLNVDASGVGASGTPSRGCFGIAGCVIDPYTTGPHIVACTGDCPSVVYYPNQGFYGYTSSTYAFSGAPSYPTSYVRTITIVQNTTDANQVTVTASMRWLNGTTLKTVNQSIVVTNWRP